MFNLPQPVKMFWLGPLFRHEKPQSGRLRQHTQLDMEIFGEEGAVADVLLILIAYNFFRELPEDIRLYLKVDVTDKDVVKRRMEHDDLYHYHRIVAIDENKIVADATICREIHNWKNHLGEIRIIINPEYQKKGLVPF